MVPKGPDGRFADETVRGAIVWHEIQIETPRWIIEHPTLQPKIVYRFCSIHNLDTMRGNAEKAALVAQTARRLLDMNRTVQLQGYWTSQAATATVHGRGDSAFIPATLDFMALANDFHPLIQKIVRSPENYHEMAHHVAALGGAGQGELDNTQRAPTLACFVVPGPLAVDTSAFNENSERVREVVVFRSLLAYLVAWTDNPF